MRATGAAVVTLPSALNVTPEPDDTVPLTSVANARAVLVPTRVPMLLPELNACMTSPPVQEFGLPLVGTHTVQSGKPVEDVSSNLPNVPRWTAWSLAIRRPFWTDSAALRIRVFVIHCE